LIDNKKILPLSIMASLAHAFSESNLPYKVDVIDLNNISNRLRKKIASGRVLFLEKRA